jgi:hypothetical protein
MKQLLYIFSILIFLSSCTSNTIYKKPKDLISQEQMVDLLVDMQLAVGAKSVKNIEEKRSNYMPLIYEKYGVDSARFARSNFYYSTTIDDYTKILQAVSVRLDTLKNKHENLLRTNDSIEKANRPTIKDLGKIQINSDSLIK